MNAANGVFDGYENRTAPVASSSNLRSDPVSMHANGQGTEGSQESSIIDHLLNAGFKQAQWSDVNVYAGHLSYALHRLVISQSPFLADIMRQLQLQHSQSRQHQLPLDVVLHFTDEHITDEAFQQVLSSMYAPHSTPALTQHNCKNILAAAMFLQLNALMTAALGTCLETIEQLSAPDDIAKWVAFVDAPVHQPGASSGMPSPAPSQDGSGQQDVGINGLASHAPASVDSLAPAERLRYGTVAVHLREALLHQLAVQLPTSLRAFAPVTRSASGAFAVAAGPSANPEGVAALISIYARLPFALLKTIIEGPTVQATDMEKFNFTKRCVAERKRQGLSGDAEETVVLAFGQGRQTVAIVRKPKRRRQLWKASPALSPSS